MRATVLTDAALAKHAGRFVWLSIDTEDPKNAPYLEKFPWRAVPTFEVLDPKSETVSYQWIGAVDAAELARRFEEGESAFRAGGTATAGPSGADAQVLALAMADKNDECAQQALELLPQLAPGPVKAGVAATGLDCALGAPAEAPWRAGAIATLEPATREAVGYPGLLDDDRSGLYGALVDARDRQNDEAGGKVAALAWLDWLDTQAKHAPSPEARAALDGYRVSASIRAGVPAREVPWIETSEREIPDDYNPPARLAILLGEVGRYDEALAASDRALAMVYGPRKLTLLNARATIYEKKGDTGAMKATLEEAIAYAATLPASQQPKGTIARLQKRLTGK
jgi:tetratricopeptide (TPR) repeat protein